jgi:hypothetical protein
MLTTGENRTNTIRLPYPHAGQQTVLREARRFNWLSAGRRWRKTTLAMAVAVEAAAHGKRVIWGAPTFDQVRVGWEEAQHGAAGIAQFRESRMTALFPGGGAILYRSLDDPHNARGHTADGVVIDECGYVSEAAWYEVLRPMLLDTDGWAWGIGTPRGHNWFWREFEAARDREDSAAWQAPTLGAEITAEGLKRKPHPLENPHNKFEEIEQLWRTLPERAFQQDILAEFVEDAGGVFRRVREAATAQPQSERIDGHTYALGVDWGQVNDFSVFAVMDVTARELVSLDRSNRVEYLLQEERLAALCQRFRPALVLAEANAMGTPIIERLRRRGLPVWAWTATNASKAEVIQSLAVAFEQGSIKILPDPTLIAELQAYQSERLPSGLLRYAAPEGMHDDTVIALALAWACTRAPRGPRSIDFRVEAG